MTGRGSRLSATKKHADKPHPTGTNNNKPTFEMYQQMEAYFYGLSLGEQKIDPKKASELAAQYPYDPVMTAWQADWHLRHAGQIKTADELWQRSVQQGLYAAASSTTRPHPYAKYHAGMLYQLGKAGLTQNYRVAVVWYKKAAAEGVASAHFQLGWLHESNHAASGTGQSSLDNKNSSHHRRQKRSSSKKKKDSSAVPSQPSNIDQARYHYEQAAAVGHAAAQYNLAELLMKHYATSNVNDDNDEDETAPMAHMLYVQAALQGYTLAKTRLKQLFAPQSALTQDNDEKATKGVEEEHEELDVLLHGKESKDTTVTKKKSAVTESTVSNLIADLLGESDRWSSAVWEDERVSSSDQTEKATDSDKDQRHTPKINEDTHVSVDMVATVTDKETVERVTTPEEIEEAIANVREAETDRPAIKMELQIPNDPKTKIDDIVVEEWKEAESEAKSVAMELIEEETSVDAEKPNSIAQTVVSADMDAPAEQKIETEGTSPQTIVNDAVTAVDVTPTTNKESTASSLPLPPRPSAKSPNPPALSKDSVALESSSMKLESDTLQTATTPFQTAEASTVPQSPRLVTKASITTIGDTSSPSIPQQSTSNKLKELLDQSRQLRTTVSNRQNELSFSSLNYNDEVDQLVQESRRFRAEASKRDRRLVETEKDADSVVTENSANIVDQCTVTHNGDTVSSDGGPVEEEGDSNDSPIPMHEIIFTANTVDEENEPLSSPEEQYDAICALLDGLNTVQINPTLALRQVNRARAKLVDEDEDPILTAFSAECHEHLRQGARTDSLMLLAVQQGLLHQAKQKSKSNEKSSGPTSTTSNKYAQYFVGTLCEHGRGGALPSAEKAAVWYQQAASQGLARAYFRWGNLYFHGQLGNDRKRDLKRARILYHKAAAQGHALAQTSLAEMYERGFGVVIDLKKAFEYRERSALQGPAQAQVLRGALYENGQLPGGVDRAKEWYERAAAQDHAGASYHLGMIYQKGLIGANAETGEPDLGKAMEYFQTAAKQGHAKAKAALESIQTRQWIGGLFDWGQVVNSFTGKA
jgi:TPR repeat protein